MLLQFSVEFVCCTAVGFQSLEVSAIAKRHSQCSRCINRDVKVLTSRDSRQRCFFPHRHFTPNLVGKPASLLFPRQDIGSKLLQFLKTPTICFVLPVVIAQTPEISYLLLLLTVSCLSPQLACCACWDFRFLAQRGRLSLCSLAYDAGEDVSPPWMPGCPFTSWISSCGSGLHRQGLSFPKVSYHNSAAQCKEKKIAWANFPSQLKETCSFSVILFCTFLQSLPSPCCPFRPTAICMLSCVSLLLCISQGNRSSFSFCRVRELGTTRNSLF